MGRGGVSPLLDIEGRRLQPDALPALRTASSGVPLPPTRYLLDDASGTRRVARSHHQKIHDLAQRVVSEKRTPPEVARYLEGF